MRNLSALIVLMLTAGSSFAELRQNRVEILEGKVAALETAVAVLNA